MRSANPSRVFLIDGQTVRQVVLTCAQRAGLGHVSAHDLRRTWARLSLAGGASIEQISRHLGHSSVQTTERYLQVELEIRPGRAAADYVRLDD